MHRSRGSLTTGRCVTVVNLSRRNEGKPGLQGATKERCTVLRVPIGVDACLRAKCKWPVLTGELLGTLAQGCVRSLSPGTGGRGTIEQWLAVGGGWRLVAVGGWWRLAVGGGWRLAVGGGWRLAVVPRSCP